MSDTFFGGCPYSWRDINLYNGSFSPSELHAKNTYLTHFYRRYLIQKVFSVFDFKNLPETWSRSYFYYVLFLSGHIVIFNEEKYGTIPQWCTLKGFNIYMEPSGVIVSNPIFGNRELTIGEDCEIIKMQPDFRGIGDMICFYADMLALSSEAAGVNLINSKFAHVFAADNQAMAESFKDVIDEIYSGKGAVFAHKKLFDADGNLRVTEFNSEPKRVYIAGDILDDMTMWDARFNADIGIPNVNVTKNSGISEEEINANNIDTKSKAMIWKETMQTCIDKVNAMFGLDISVDLTFDHIGVEGGEEYGSINDAGSVLR